MRTLAAQGLLEVSQINPKLFRANIARDDEYQGWKNRETWCVALWINNEQGTQEFARALVRNPGECPTPSRALEEWVDDEDCFGSQLEGFPADMRNSFLARVDWREIAQSLLED